MTRLCSGGGGVTSGPPPQAPVPVATQGDGLHMRSWFTHAAGESRTHSPRSDLRLGLGLDDPHVMIPDQAQTGSRTGPDSCCKSLGSAWSYFLQEKQMEEKPKQDRSSPASDVIKAESTSKVEGWGNDMSSSSTSPDMSVTISLFLKTGTSIQDHLHGITERHQP
uniref:Uncharacterized protein n=1 Tax=Knipowitschia caucasica TaxID=637954 RepID=A0AAV2J2X3_KNICA